VSEIRDLVREVMEEPEMQRLLVEAVHAATIPKKDEPCTLANLEVFYPRLNEKLVYSRWLKEAAIQYIQLNRKNPILLDCVGKKGKTFKLNLSAVQNNWIQFFFNLSDKEIEKNNIEYTPR
jgi:hypothetical protein